MRVCDVQVGVLRVGEQRSPVMSAFAIHAARWNMEGAAQPELANPNPACVCGRRSLSPLPRSWLSVRCPRLCAALALCACAASGVAFAGVVQLVWC